MATIVLLLSVLLAPATQGASAKPASKPSGIIVLAPYFQQGYWWDHTTLTVFIKSGGNVDPSAVQAVLDAIAIWNGAITSRGVEMIDVSGDPSAAATADIVVNLQAQGGSLFGVANCQSGQRCTVMAWEHDRAATNSRTYFDLSYTDLVSLAVHEIGHALGVGHVDPLYGTMDVMGYGTDTVLFPDPVISKCDMLAFDAAWEWLFTSGTPYQPTTEYVAC